MKKLVLLTLFTLTTSIIFAQADSINTNSTKGNLTVGDTTSMAKVYFIRSTGYTGAAVNIRVVVDSIMMCKIKNDRQALFYVQPGTHTFYASTWDGPKARAGLGLNLSLDAGKTYYFTIRMKQKLMGIEVTVEEITANTALPQLAKYKHDECD